MLSAICKDYVNLLKGGGIDTDQRLSDLRRTRNWYRDILILLAEADLAAGTVAQQHRVIDYLRWHPNDREFWVLFDAYRRKRPVPGEELFYECLKWLHGHDPWVKQAVAEYRKKKTSQTASVDVATIKGMLAEFDTAVWPTFKSMRTGSANASASSLPYGSVAMATKAFIKEGNHDQARDMVLRYKNFATVLTDMSVGSEKSHALRAHCNHLLHLIKASRKK